MQHDGTIIAGDRATELIAEIFAGRPEDPAPLYDEVRELDDGVHFFAPADAFFAFRYGDVLTIARDPNFSSEFLDQWPLGLPEATDSDHVRLFEFCRRFMAFNDPPRHTALRGVVRKAFTPNAVDRWRPTVERAVDALLDRFGAGDEVDFVSQLSIDVPVDAICAVLGIEHVARPMIRAGTVGLAAVFDPTFLGDARDQAIADALRMVDDIAALVDERRARPAQDLVSLVLESEGDASGDLDATDVLCQLVFLIAAGNHTTVSMLSSGVLHLLRHDRPRAELQHHPELVNAFVNETLRLSPPIHIPPPRLVKQPTTLGGTELPAGSLVFQVLGAANRDPRKFDDAGQFRLDRRSNAHLTFNHGIHSCVGAPLARLEGEIFFTRFLTRFPRFTSGRQPARLHAGHVQVRDVDVLPIRL